MSRSLCWQVIRVLAMPSILLGKLICKIETRCRQVWSTSGKQQVFAMSTHSDGAFGKHQSRGTISDAEWAKLNRRALEAATEDLLDRRIKIGRANFNKREEC